VYEVLNLAALLPCGARAQPALQEMLERMREFCNEGNVPPEAAAPLAAPRPGGSLSRRMTAADTCFADGDPVTGWLLEWFSPFNELSDTQRDIIAGYEIIRRAPAGTRLLCRGEEDDRCIYVVEGELSLVTPDGGNMQIRGGTRRSRLPISVLSPHVYDVTAATDVSIIVFSQTLVRQIIDITRTYTGIDSPHPGLDSTAAISNGVQSLYLSHAQLTHDGDPDPGR